MALKQQVYVFLLSQHQSHVKYRRKLNFAILQRQHMCTARFRLYKRFFWSLWWFQTTPIHKFALFTWLFSVWGWLAVFFARLAAFDLAAMNSPFSCLRRSKKVRPKGEMKFRAWNIKSLTVRFQISFMSRTCDLQNSCGVNVTTYLRDNLWRDIKKIRPQCDPCLKVLDVHVVLHEHYEKWIFY